MDRIALMAARADAGECDLIAKGNVFGEEHGFVYESGSFRTDSSHFPTISEDKLMNLAKDERHALTFTCVPVGSGYRMGIDRNANGIADGDESHKRHR